MFQFNIHAAAPEPPAVPSEEGLVSPVNPEDDDPTVQASGPPDVTDPGEESSSNGTKIHVVGPLDDERSHVKEVEEPDGTADMADKTYLGTSRDSLSRTLSQSLDRSTLPLLPASPSLTRASSLSLSQLPPLPPSRSDSSYHSSVSSLSLSRLPPLPASRSVSSGSSRSGSARSSVSESPSLTGPRFEATGRDFEGSEFSVAGRCYCDADGVVRFNFVLSYPNSTYSEEHWSGHIDEEGSLVGYKAYWYRPSQESHEQMFIFRRIPSAIMALRPTPAELVDNKHRAMWHYAINATLYRLRKKWWTWSFFRERRNHRIRYLTLNLAMWTYGRQPEGEEHAEFLRMRKGVLPEDENLIRSMRDHLTSTMPKHWCALCPSI